MSRAISSDLSAALTSQPSQHPINRRLTDKLTIRFIQYDPAPAGLTIKDFYYSLLKVQVQIFHIYQSLVPFQPDPVVQTKHGLTFRLHWIEIHMESFGNRLTYATVIDILGGLADMMRDRDLAVLQFTVLETGEQYSEAITNGWIGKDPNYYVGKSNDTTLDSYGAVSRVQPTQNLSTPTS